MRILACITSLLLVVPAARAQWTTQRIPLQPGWNAIYLQVAPADADCDTAFAAMPAVQSVWKFDRRFTTIEFDQNPAAVLPEPDHWLAWLPRGHPEAFLRTLTILQGGQAYLVKVAENSPPLTWQVKGIPALPSGESIPNAMNLAGLPVDAAQAPSFADVFADSPQIESNPGTASGVYAIGSDGKELQVRQTARTLVEPGKAYWFQLRGAINWTGPLALEGELATRRIDFGRDRDESVSYLRNNSTNTSLTIRLRVLASEIPPAGQAELAGPVPLAYFHSDLAVGQFEWKRVPDELVLVLGPGEQKELRLGVVRRLLASYTPVGSKGAAYQGLLEIREGPHGLRLLVPVSAESDTVRRVRLQAGGSLAGAAGRDAGPPGPELPVYSPRQGLWVGRLSLTHVSRPPQTGTNTADSGPLLLASSPLNTRLLVHVSTNGAAQLLQRVVLAWQGPQTNGAYRLFADESRVPASPGEVYRVSTATLPPIQPLPLEGILGDVLKGRVNLGYDDPVNPFKHAYHPDHDNLDEQFSTNRLPAGLESYDVSRRLQLNFYVTRKTADGLFAPPGPVLSFNGTNSSLAVDPVTSGGTFTVEAWVRAQGYGSRGSYLYYAANGADDALYLKLEPDTGRMTFGSRNGAQASELTTTNAFPTNRWVYVAAVCGRPGDTNGLIYWDANVAAQGALTVPAAVTRTNVQFGAGPGATEGFFRGQMYDLVLWASARRPEGVYADMYLSYSEDEDIELAYFKANEGTGATLKDVDGGPLTARLVGVTWDTSQAYRSAFWGIGEWEGEYTETIAGLRPEAILVKGQFRLERVSRDGELR